MRNLHTTRALSRRASLLVILGLGLAVQARGQYILVDFGTSNSYRGVTVPIPDENGNIWNGFAPAEYVSNLVDTAGSPSGISMGFTSPVVTDSYDGPAGPTSSPPTPEETANTLIDPVALGVLGVTNAAFDYFGVAAGFTGTFTLANLDPLNTYNLTFFGSKKYPTGEGPGDPDSRSTLYVVTDSLGTPLDSVGLAVGEFADHNSNTLASLFNVVPDAQNRIFVEFRGLSPTNAGYINAMLIEVVEPPPPPVGDQILLIDFGSDASFGGTSVPNPDTNGSYWNSLWSGGFFGGLVDIFNQTTALGLGFDLASGTDNFNGPAGAVDAAALGLIGGAVEAVNDYYVTSQFQIQGLDPTNSYTLTFFGSHKFSADDATVYRIYTDAGYSNEVASVSLNVQTPGSPGLHNSNNVAYLAYLAPQESNALYIEFVGSTGKAGYLNAMRIDVHYPPPLPPEVYFEEIEQAFGDISVGFLGASGISYTLQYTTHLPDEGSWQDVTVGGVPVTIVGDGTSFLRIDDVETTDPWRSYRLIETP